MFLTVDLDEDDHRRAIDYLHLKNATMPMVMIVNMINTDIERFRGVPGVHDNMITGDFGIEPEKVTQFGLDFLKGKVPRYYHSEEIPEDWNNYNVKVN